MTNLRYESSMPLVVALMENPDIREYQDALELDKLAGQSYDPESQTSLIPAHAGTSLTYRSTGTGNPFRSDSDQKRDDT